MPAEWLAGAEKWLAENGEAEPDIAEPLRAKVATYKESVRRTTLGDPRALSGIEGFEQATGYRQPADTELAAEAKPTRQGAGNKQHSNAPEVAKALGEQAPVGDEEAQALRYQADANDQVIAQNLENSKLPTLSKDPRLAAPPRTGGEEGIPFVSYGVHFEPSLEQFRHDMGAELFKKYGVDADALEQMQESSMHFKRYADAVWQQEYEKAVGKGRPLSRHSQMDKDTGLGRELLLSGVRAVLAVPAGMASTVSAGMDTALMRNPSLASKAMGVPAAAGATLALPSEPGFQLPRVPEAEVRGYEELQNSGGGKLGQFAGYLTRGGVPGQLMGLSRGLLGAGKSPIGRAAIGTAAGALAAGGEQVTSDVAQSADTGKFPEGMAERAGTATLLGGLFGLGGEAVTAAARGAKRKLMQSEAGAHLEGLEQAGAERGLFGVRESPGMKQIRDATQDAGLANKTESLAAARLLKPMTKAAFRHQEDVDVGGFSKAELGRRADAYLDTPEGLEKHLTTELDDELLAIVQSRDGAPGALSVREFRELSKELFETTKVRLTDVNRMAAAGWKKMPTLDDAVDAVDDVAEAADEGIGGALVDAYERFVKLYGPDDPEALGMAANMAAAQKRGTGKLGSTTVRESGEAVDDAGGAVYASLEDARLRVEKNMRAHIEAMRAKDRAAGSDTIQDGPVSGDTIRDTVTIPPSNRINFGDTLLPPWANPAAPPPPGVPTMVSPGAGMKRGSDALTQVSPGGRRGKLTKVGDNTLSVEENRLARQSAERQLLREAQAKRKAQQAKEQAIARKKREPVYVEMGRAIPVDARTLKASLEGLDKRAKFSTEGKGGPIDPAWQRVAIAARKVRDKFKDNELTRGIKATHPDGTETTGYSALNTAYSEAVDRGARHLKGAGYPEELKLRSDVSVGGTSAREVDAIPPAAGRPGAPDLDVEMSEAAQREATAAIQNYWARPGSARSDDMTLRIARLAGVENELKLHAGIAAAKALKNRETEALALGTGGLRGRLLGSVPALASRAHKTLNRLAAEPSAAGGPSGPPLSTKLRSLLRWMQEGRQKGLPPTMGPSGLPQRSPLGMGGGGASMFSALRDRDEPGRDELEPHRRGLVLDATLNDVELNAAEQGIFRDLLDSVTGPVADSINRQIVPPPAPRPQESAQEEMMP